MLIVISRDVALEYTGIRMIGEIGVHRSGSGAHRIDVLVVGMLRWCRLVRNGICGVKRCGAESRNTSSWSDSLAYCGLWIWVDVLLTGVRWRFLKFLEPCCNSCWAGPIQF